MSSLDRLTYEDGYEAGYSDGTDARDRWAEEDWQDERKELTSELKQLRDDAIALLESMDKEPEDLKIALQNIRTTIRVVDEILGPDNRKETVV